MIITMRDGRTAAVTTRTQHHYAVLEVSIDGQPAVRATGWGVPVPLSIPIDGRTHGIPLPGEDTVHLGLTREQAEQVFAEMRQQESIPGQPVPAPEGLRRTFVSPIDHWMLSSGERETVHIYPATVKRNRFALPHRTDLHKPLPPGTWAWRVYLEYLHPNPDVPGHEAYLYQESHHTADEAAFLLNTWADEKIRSGWVETDPSWIQTDHTPSFEGDM